MRTTLAALSLAAVIGLTLGQNAAALPANPGAIEQSASAAAPLARVQFYERHTRHGLVKCYREFVIGRYVCRHVW
jgi:hypothetical protein